MTSPNGVYRVNGHCACKAAQNGHKECKHRCAKRLWELYEAAELTAFIADVEASPRQNLIAEIENIWPRVETTPLAVALMARFGKNRLDMLDDDMLHRVRLAIAL